MSLMCSFFKSS